MAKGPRPRDPRIRFLAKVWRSDPCWWWTGARSGRYGHFLLNDPRRIIQAQRAAYLLFIGEIPADHEVRLICRNDRCVRPEHLEAHPLANRGERLRGTRWRVRRT